MHRFHPMLGLAVSQLLLKCLLTWLTWSMFLFLRRGPVIAMPFCVEEAASCAVSCAVPCAVPCPVSNAVSGAGCDTKR